MENIKVVDDIVKRTERLVSQFYGDEDTVFIFTADHGMSKIGNHGDGGMVGSEPTTCSYGELITKLRRPGQHSNSSHHLG